MLASIRHCEGGQDRFNINLPFSSNSLLNPQSNRLRMLGAVETQ